MNENITYCTKCGSTLLEEDKFCTSCGSEVRQRPSAHKHPDLAQTAEKHSEVAVKDKDDNARALREETEEEKGGEPPVTAYAKIKNRGITRLPYWVLSFIGGLIPGFMAQSILSKYYFSFGQFLLDVSIVFITGGVIQTSLAYFRIKNTGLNPLLSLLILIPIVNTYPYFLSSCYQEDYSDTRELDNAGWALIYALLFIFTGGVLWSHYNLGWFRGE
jgi:hypothetical protein